MAKLVLGLGTSHGPLLATPPDQWHLRVPADRGNSELYFRGVPHTFDELVQLRASENLAAQITAEQKERRFAACQQAIGQLAEKLKEAAPDAVVIIGDDQEEVFLWDNMPAFSVYWGDTVDNVPPTQEQADRMPAGLAVAIPGHYPPQRLTHPTEPTLGRHLIESLIADEFDVAQSREMPAGYHDNHGIPHAYAFVYRRLMNDNVIPNVPVFINTFYPPNQPTLRRTYAFGQAVGRAIASWDPDKKVAVIASGGLTHYVIEEDLDRQVLACLEQGDHERLLSLSPEFFDSGNSEIRNWIAAGGALADSGLRMRVVDYVPCYRSEAGTGNAMGFTVWE